MWNPMRDTYFNTYMRAEQLEITEVTHINRPQATNFRLF